MNVQSVNYQSAWSMAAAAVNPSSQVSSNTDLQAVVDRMRSSGQEDDAVSVNFSASHDVFKAVDTFFNLNAEGRFEAFNNLSPEEKAQSLKMVGELAQRGFVGYENLLVNNNRVERHDVLLETGDKRLRSARVYERTQLK